MTHYIDVMVDLETCGTGPNAAIAAIGAVVFDRSANTLGATYYCAIDISTSVDGGGAIDADTFKWWIRQTPEAQKSTFSGSSHINQALLNFSVWLGKQCLAAVVTGLPPEVRVWGNGADFDIVVLGQSYKRAHMPTPWKFWNVRCFRTLKAEHSAIKMERSGTHHNALDDATTQAMHVLKIDQIRTRPPEEHGLVIPLPNPALGGYINIDSGNDLRRSALVLNVAIVANLLSLALNLYNHFF